MMKKLKTSERIKRILLKRIHRMPLMRACARRFIARRAPIDYRIAQKEDMETLGRFLHGEDETAFTLFMEESFTCNPDVFRLLARVRGAIVASATISKHQLTADAPEDWWLSGLYVLPTWRGCGIGAGMTELALQQTCDLGQPALKLIVNKNNVPAVALYVKLGFYEIPPPFPKSASSAETPAIDPHALFMENRIR